ncbi:MAG: amino acid permease [Verrucomicrobia bacterium]|nr:amino acid permease [Verrucomicrobiota bacterium]
MHDPDERELRRFGYAQQLRRTLGGFSSFAVAFSLISVFTGVSANFGHGLRQVGGGIVWSWLIVLAGQMLVALLLTELATRIPLSGYGYQWASRLVNPHFGFSVGWLLLLQFLTGFPGVCATLAAQTGHWLGDDWASSSAVTALTLAIIALTAMIHLFGIRWAARVNDTGVWTELLGVFFASLVLIVLALQRGAPPAVLFDSTNAATGSPAGLGAWALSLLVGAWCLTGFEAAADLAEETRQPKRVVPRAILLSLLSSGVAGFLLLTGVMLAVGDLAAAQKAGDPLMTTLRQALGTGGAGVVRVVIGISIFACGLASMAATSRLLFALGRDRMLPGSRWLASVAENHRTPRNAILFIWLVSSAVVLGLPTLDIVTQISAVAGYLGYAGIIIAALIAPPATQSDGWRLGRARPWIGTAALIWVLGVVAALTIPPTEVAGIRTRHLPLLSTLVGLGIGLFLYLTLIRRRLVRGEAGPPTSGEDIPSTHP